LGESLNVFQDTFECLEPAVATYGGQCTALWTERLRWWWAFTTATSWQNFWNQYTRVHKERMWWELGDQSYKTSRLGNPINS